MLIVALALSFAAGLIVGLYYAVIRVPSPVPPPIALVGLAGLLLSGTILGLVFG